MNNMNPSKKYNTGVHSGVPEGLAVKIEIFI
jgi:hypothetical protein